MEPDPLKLLFIINPGAGKQKRDWKKEIETYFSGLPHTLVLFEMPNPCEPGIIRKQIETVKAGRVIAVGGDGTLKLLVDILQGTGVPIGLLPAGSANGMARELGIPLDPSGALDVLVHGEREKIHLIKINGEFCIHLSDLGFNAFVVKKFEDRDTRGMWGYIKAAWKVLWAHSRMQINIKTGAENIRREAAMVVIANATRYGTGVLINPEGRLDDDRFEVVIVKKISFAEIFKMRFTHKAFHPEKTELLQAKSLAIKANHRMHFQVDGEYRGKITTVTAQIVPEALVMLVPRVETKT